MQLSVVQLLSVLVALAACPSTVDAAHSSLERSFARRSLTKKAINLDLNLPKVVSSILGNDEDDDEPSPPRISSPSSLPDVTAILPPTSVEPTTSLTSSSTPSSVSPSISSVSSSSVSSSTSSQEPSSSLSSASLTSSSSISTSSSIEPSTTRGGGILDPITSGLGGITSVIGDVTSILLPPPPVSTSSSVQPSSSSEVESTPSTPPTSASESSTTAVSEAESTSSATPTTTRGGGILDPITSALGGVTSVIGDVTSILLPAPPSSSASSAPSSAVEDPDTPSASSSAVITSAPEPEPTSSRSGGIIDTLTSVIGGGISSILDPPPPSSSRSSSVPLITDPPTITSSAVEDPISSSPSSQPGGILTSILTSIISEVSSAIGGGESSPPITSFPPITTSVPPTSEPQGPETSVPPTSEPPIPDTSLPPTTVFPPQTSVPPTSVPPVPDTSAPPTTVSDGGATATSVIISFPSGNATTGALPTSLPDQTVSDVVTSISIDSELSGILTQTALVFASLSTSTELPTLTDPDQATTTVTPVQQSAQADVAPTAAPLPTGMPARIYPRNGTDPTTEDLGDYSLISILFTPELNWEFVATNPLSPSQIFGYFPVILQTALVLPPDQVKTWVLQVYASSDYKGPRDASKLRTMWLGYIPRDEVDNLAAQIKAPQSKFYTGIADPVAKDLARRVDSGFAINSVSQTDPGTGGGLGGPGNASSSSASSSDKARQDAIIGVVSTLGAIALIVLAYLVYRSIKRRNELKHRRLSDVPAEDMAGYRPDGRDFDQDSVGGARRRSFYFAEDSLRGYQDQRIDDGGMSAAAGQGYGYGGAAVAGPSQMTQRRQVMPAAISAPILRENTMNW
ncbi:hypothetical protein PTI98_010727 [Pleurotus ostreatus]|nr:hypothetical protein PTI98_010727 [Pleurotus ostreatus]